MKKLVLFIALIFIIGCQQSPDPPKETIQLSELETTACNAADKAGTCDTRLQDVGIISKETCCEMLGKCC